MRTAIETSVITLLINNTSIMKKVGLLIVSICMVCNIALSQESLRLTFTGRIGEGYYQRLDGVGIRNVTRDWAEVIYYPDTTLVISSPTNVDEHEGFESVNVAPNPFQGESHVSFYVEKPAHVILTVYGLMGNICCRHESTLAEGKHSYKVSLSKPQVYILSVQVGEKHHVAKLNNFGHSSNDYIELTSSEGTIQYVPTRGNVVHPFQYGDIMEYVGYATINGSVVSSERLTQSQFFNEDIALQFSAYLPVVETDYVDNIQQTTATCGGTVTSDGWASVTSRGVCWSTQPNPTIADAHTNDQNGLGHFTSSITGLSANTEYYVRAYATNSVGTAYGNEYSFRTEPESIWPNGTLPGLFSVDPIQKVQFSQGNLQYKATTNTWRFADTQYEIIGEANVNKASDYDGYIDLFGWGTSGFNHGAYCYQPWSTSSQNSNYYAYGSAGYNLFDRNGKADWGYNAIVNGGNQEFYWRTLTVSEWDYILNYRVTSSGIRYAKVTITETMLTGVILLPDDWDESIFWLTHTNDFQAGYYTNPISIDDLNYLEINGVVFLPCSGSLYWDYTGLIHLAWSDGSAYYWTSSMDDLNYAKAVWGCYTNEMNRSSSAAVRLARTTAFSK